METKDQWRNDQAESEPSKVEWYSRGEHLRVWQEILRTVPVNTFKTDLFLLELGMVICLWKTIQEQRLLHRCLLKSPKRLQKNLWVWGFAIFASIMGIYFEVWKKCDQVAGDLSGLAFYAVFLADGITPTASHWDVAFAFAPGFFMGWGVVTGLAYLVKKVRG